MKYSAIAIDGPAGSGKSTVAKSVAKGLGFTYIDTGAMYRAITLKALRLNINLNNENEYEFIKSTKLEFRKNLMFMDDEDVSVLIRGDDVVQNVSLVSSLGYVRELLVEEQRNLAKKNNVVMDGRDICTNVLKDADLKIFLTADVKVRALRRYEELKEKDSNITYEDVVKDLIRRDDYDSNRKINPLKKADDAILIDTSDMTIEETSQNIMHLYKELKNE